MNRRNFIRLAAAAPVVAAASQLPSPPPPSLPQFASGGIVPGPKGHPRRVVVGERGPEMIVTINDYGVDPQKLVAALRRFPRQHGRSAA